MSKLTENTLTLTGRSGSSYIFQIYSLDTTFNAVGGIYIFSRRYFRDNHYYHNFIYIGRTEDFSTRFINHHKQRCIERSDANALCILQEGSQRTREQIEIDLLSNNTTICNEVNN